jgi:uncharacterized protein
LRDPEVIESADLSLVEIFDYIFVLKVVVCCLSVYSLVLLILVRYQRGLLFQRYPLIFWTQHDEEPTTHTVISTADGEVLDAVWLKAPGPPCGALLYLHGNATNLKYRMSRIRALAALGFSVLAIDWRGFGKSTGVPSQAGCQLDAVAALRWLSQRTDPSQIAIVAESLGSGIAVELVAKHNVGALILEAPFSSAVDVAQAFLPIFPVRLLMTDQFRSDLVIDKIRTPLLVQHGLSDFIVPFRFGERLYALAPEPKRFIQYVGGGHNNLPEKFLSYCDLKRFVLECFDANKKLSGRGEECDLM